MLSIGKEPAQIKNRYLLSGQDAQQIHTQWITSKDALHVANNGSQTQEQEEKCGGG